MHPTKWPHPRKIAAAAALGLAVAATPLPWLLADEAPAAAKQPAANPPAAAAEPKPAGEKVGDGKAADAKSTDAKSADARRAEPKPLSEPVKKALAWLAAQQQPDGGWNQGEVSQGQARGGEQIDKSNVADTCMAALAFLRAGHSPKEGDHAETLRKAAAYVCAQVEQAPAEGLVITDNMGTRVQSKLGRYVDTFAAALFLAEIKDRMESEASRKRVVAALDKVMDKVEKNQRQDGQFVDANDGWAGALCQGLAFKAVNRAAQVGADVDGDVLKRAERFANNSFDAQSGAVAAPGSAGIELYARSANLVGLQEASKTNAPAKTQFTATVATAAEEAQRANDEADRLEREGDSPKADAARAQARQAEARATEAKSELERIDKNDKSLQQAQARVVERLADRQFVAGFGNNGGEEFLSYMNIGESLLAKGGEDFAKWDKAMTENLTRVQNEDGSWTGHHCITGRTFCTAAALLTLTVDRAAPAPVAANIGKGAAR